MFLIDLTVDCSHGFRLAFRADLAAFHGISLVVETLIWIVLLLGCACGFFDNGCNALPDFGQGADRWILDAILGD